MFETDFFFNLVLMLCHWKLLETHIFQFHSVGNTIVTKDRMCEVGA
jgi:hypothetical protein